MTDNPIVPATASSTSPVYDAPFPLQGRASLTPLQRMVERDLAVVVGDVQLADRRYAQVPESLGGSVINADGYRELSPWFATGTIPTALDAQMVEDVPAYAEVRGHPLRARRMVRTHLTSATTQPASAASKDRILRCATTEGDARTPPHLLLITGGSGSGKTRFVTTPPALVPPGAAAFDTTLTSTAFATQVIDGALSRGGSVTVCYIATTFRDAMQRMIGRACTDGRYISASGMAANHEKSRSTMRDIIRHYRPQRCVRLRIIRSDHLMLNPVPLDAFLDAPSPPLDELTHDAHHCIAAAADRIPADLLRRLAR